jgi:hypothetical protein
MGGGHPITPSHRVLTPQGDGLSAHRRSASREELASGFRTAAPRGRRRASSSSRLVLPLALGVAVIAVGALAGPSVVGRGWRTGPAGADRERITFASVPKDAPELGLVYRGLKEAPTDALCAGAYEMDDPETCTHGPDPAPAGLKVSRDVSPVTRPAAEPQTPTREAPDVPSDAEIVRDEGGTALASSQPALVPDAAPGDADFIMGSHDVACEADGRAGKRVQVLYLHEFGAPSRYSEYLGSIRNWAAGVDAIFDASAAETGGSRHVRFVTTPSCQVDVAEVQAPTGALTSFTTTIDALQKLGYNRADRKYLLFADANVYCGIGTFIADHRPGVGNRNNGGPAYGRVDAGCWNAATAARELTYNLGASLQNSPNATVPGHCADDYDLLCTRDDANTTLRTVCPDKKHERLLDCNHDDYFSTQPKAGSYLAENWNVAQNEFLLKGDGGDDLPVDNAPAKKPAAPPTSLAASGPTASPGPAAPDAGGDGVSPTTPTAADPESGGAASVRPSALPATSAATTAPAEQLTAPVQAVLEIREPTSTAVRLTWSAASDDAKYDVSVDGVLIATTVATRAHLIGLRPDTKYQVTVQVAGDAKRYTARGEAATAPAAQPADNSWFVLTNSLTGGAADLYAAREADGTPIVLNGNDGGAQQQWKLVPAGGGVFSLVSKASGKCVVPQGNNPAVGTPLVQGDCATDDVQHWAVKRTDHGFSLSTTVGGLVVGAGTQRFGAHRVLVLQQPERARHQSWTALPG